MLLACFLELHLNSRSWKHGRWYYKRFCYKHLYYLHEWIFQRFALGTRIFKDVATKRFFLYKKKISFIERWLWFSLSLLVYYLHWWSCENVLNLPIKFSLIFTIITQKFLINVFDSFYANLLLTGTYFWNHAVSWFWHFWESNFTVKDWCKDFDLYFANELFLNWMMFISFTPHISFFLCFHCSAPPPPYQYNSWNSKTNHLRTGRSSAKQRTTYF